jgi:hypothetical protein
LRANAVAFHDGLGTQRPHAFEVPGARGPRDASRAQKSRRDTDRTLAISQNVSH